MKVQHISKALRSMGIDAKASARGDARSIIFNHDGVVSSLLFADPPAGSIEEFDGLIFQTGFPNDGGVTEIDADEFNAAVPTAKCYLLERTVMFNSVHYIPSSLMSGDLFRHLVLVWLVTKQEILDFFASE